MADRALTVKEVAARFGVGIHTVLHWISTHQLMATNVGRSLGKMRPRWRITEKAVCEFEQLRTPSPPAPRTRRSKKDEGIIEFYK